MADGIGCYVAAIKSDFLMMLKLPIHRIVDA